MFKGARKDDLRRIASELGVTLTDKLTVIELTDLIKGTDRFKIDPDSVSELASLIIDERKSEEAQQLELEKLQLEKAKTELELAKIRQEVKCDNNSDIESTESLESLIKSIRTLTIKIPSKPEGWGFFFVTLERAFLTKNVTDNLKAEILLNLLGEKASNIITYIEDDKLNDYEKVKAIVLREFQPTALSCLENFKKTNRQAHETFVQYATRLTNSWDYYLKLRDVSDFESLRELIVSDKIFQNLDKETASHIGVRQGDKWFKPSELGKEIDLYYTSRGKSFTENPQNVAKNPRVRNTPQVFLSDTKSIKCTFCNGNHSLYKCVNYNKLSVNERVQFVKDRQLCFNCLSNHKVSQCKSKYSCSICKRRHNITLHFPESGVNSLNTRHETDNTSNKFPPLSPLAAEFQPSDEVMTAASYFSNSSKTVLLSTAVCFLSDHLGEIHKLRCIMDSGSMSNFITRDCADRLKLKKEKINIIVSGLNDSCMTVRSRVSGTLSNENKQFEKKLDFLMVPKITNLTPSRSLNIDLQDFSNIQLADENFNKPGPVDILLGADTFYELLRPGQIYIPNSKLVLQNTVFGFLINGAISNSNEETIHCGLIQNSLNLENALKKFWEVENIEPELVKNEESIICEEHFKQNHSRNAEGKYIVKMPFKEDPSCLGKSKDIALRKLNSLWNRLAKDPEYLGLYKSFLREYLELGHMTEVKESDENMSYFIPHLGVYRSDSKSTPLRVVFNASSPTTNGKSLNSLQYNGGIIQDDLLSIMIRFRKYAYAFTADIKKMYRMILIHPSQRPLQTILWKEENDGLVKTYELNTVTYGTVSAPFLAVRTLKQLAIDEVKEFPIAAPVLIDSFYMDDVLSGSGNLEKAKELQRQLVGILKKSGMELHKWLGNHPDLLMSSDKDYNFVNSEETKALGVSWQSNIDCFSFKAKVETGVPFTKRTVLSTIARIFDPLGLLGPIIAKAKIFMQKLWLLSIDWNDQLPVKEQKEWQSFIDSLPCINNIKIPRCIISEGTIEIQLHGFADASEAAYAAVVYCRSLNTSGEIIVHLVTSKSRVSPLKRITIPRLELMAAVLLAKLMNKVTSSLKLDVSETYLWSDSMVTLSWIRKEPYQLKTFISNRVTKIQELTTVQQWHHVPSQENPADLISRGVDPDKLSQSKLWLSGPEFLATDNYPERDIPIEVIGDEFLRELKKKDDINCSFLFVLTQTFLKDLFSISNVYMKIIRVLSFIFRFIENCRGNLKKKGPLDSQEMRKAELTLIKIVQGIEFRKEIKKLREGNMVSPDSQVRNLNPFLDEEGVLRVGGRLANSDLSIDKKFPIILPSKHQLTTVILGYFHKKYLHIGPQALLYNVRQLYWPINGRNECRKVVHNCVVCIKAKPVTCQQLMGNLPKERTTQDFPFNCSGVDFCGPFWIKYRHQRKGIYHKVYVAVFVCFVTKAVHLEMVTDLTSQAFVATLKRFFSRRGKSSYLFSDNAKNFIGSNIELKKLHTMVKTPDDELAAYLSNENVDWKFIPPRAPHFGGLWEAGVKAFKYHLKRVVGNQKLSYEDFLTVTTQIEAILNSRPLTPLSADIDDLSVLTPGHFLIGRPITSLVEPNLSEIEFNRLKLYQRVTKMVQLIWKKWTNNYLSTLQQRTKWFFEKDNVRVGDLVLIKNDDMAVGNWIIGRLIEVFPGSDGKIRVVKVKTKNGEFTRPITKIAILPLEK